MRIAPWLAVGLLMVASATATAAPKGKKRPAGQINEDVEEDDDAPAKPTKKSKPAKRSTAADDEEEPARRGSKSAATDDDDSTADDDELRRIAEEPVDERLVIIDTRARKKAKPPKREFYFRAGIAHVEPRTKSSGMQLEPVGIAKLMPMDPPKGGIVTDPANVITAILGFAPETFRGYLSFETLIGIPKKSKLRATGDLATKSLAPTALDLIPTGVPPLGEEIGEASAAPLMVTAVARSPELGGRVRGYVGLGPALLLVRGAKVTNEVLTEVATPKIETSPAFGVAAQAGVDVKIAGRIHARLDVKEMWFQPAETRISNIHVKTTIPLLETVEVGSARSQVQANPLVVQLGVGASF